MLFYRFDRSATLYSITHAVIPEIFITCKKKEHSNLVHILIDYFFYA